MIVRELLTRFGLDFDRASFSRADNAVSALKGAAIKLASVFAVAKIASELRQMVLRTVDLADSTDEAAQRLGIAADTLQELRFAAKIGGGTVEELDQGLTMLSRKAGEAASGNKEAAESFARLGVRVRDANGKVKGADVLMGEVADAMQKLPTQVERTQVAMSVFGRSGKNFALILKDGSEGLRAAREEAHALGAVMSAELLKQAGRLDNNLHRLDAAIQGIKNTIVEALAPALNEAIEGVIGWLKRNREWLRLKTREWVARVVVGVRAFVAWLRVAGRVVSDVIDTLGGFRAVLIAIGVFMGGALLVYIGNTVIALTALGNAGLLASLKMIAIPALIGAAFVAFFGLMFLLWQEVKANFTDVDGLFEKMTGKWGELTDALLTEAADEDAWWLTRLLKAALALQTQIIHGWDRLFAFGFGNIKLRTAEDIQGLEEAADAARESEDALAEAQRKRRAFAFLPAAERQRLRAAGQAPDAIGGIFDEQRREHRIRGQMAQIEASLGRFATVLQPGAGLGAAPTAQVLSGPRVAGPIVTNAPTVNVTVDASGQTLNEVAVTDMIGERVHDALTTSWRQTFHALGQGAK